MFFIALCVFLSSAHIISKHPCILPSAAFYKYDAFCALHKALLSLYPICKLLVKNTSYSEVDIFIFCEHQVGECCCLVHSIAIVTVENLHLEG